MAAAQCKPFKQKAQVRTNTTRGSACKINVLTVKFSDLWDSYVADELYRDAKTDDVPPDLRNQYAIRMSVTPRKVGIEMGSFTSMNVSIKPDHQFGRILMEGRYTAVLADQMGSWLNKHPSCGLHRTEDITGRGWESKVKRRTGIIMFDSYWSRSSGSAGDTSDGHIDL